VHAEDAEDAEDADNPDVEGQVIQRLPYWAKQLLSMLDKAGLAGASRAAGDSERRGVGAARKTPRE